MMCRHPRHTPRRSQSPRQAIRGRRDASTATRGRLPIVEVPPVRNVEPNRAEPTGVRLLSRDDLATMKVHHRRTRVLRRDKCEHPVALTERFEGAKHVVVPVITGDDGVPVKHVNVDGAPSTRRVGKPNTGGVPLTRRRPRGNLEESTGVDLFDPEPVIANTVKVSTLNRLPKKPLRVPPLLPHPKRTNKPPPILSANLIDARRAVCTHRRQHAKPHDDSAHISHFACLPLPHR